MTTKAAVKEYDELSQDEQDAHDAIEELGWKPEPAGRGWAATRGEDRVGPCPTLEELKVEVEALAGDDPGSEISESETAESGQKSLNQKSIADAARIAEMRNMDWVADEQEDGWRAYEQSGELRDVGPVATTAALLEQVKVACGVTETSHLNGEHKTRSQQIAEMFPIPDKGDFEGKQFLQSNELKTVAETLIEKYQSDFSHLDKANIVYLWKESGGVTAGQAMLGKCIKPSGLAAFFAAPVAGANVDYFVWVAADHLRENRANYRTICALLFHELKHTAYEEGKFVVVGHEFEGFAREIEEFGMWQHSIRKIAEACETVKDVQQGLFTNYELAAVSNA